MLQGILS
jgi:hypothetical protein